MGMFLSNLRDIHWEILLVKYLELWEVILMASQMEKFIDIFRVPLWERHLVQNPELR